MSRRADARTALGAVRQRHTEIQKIEKTLNELNVLFRELGETVQVQEAPVQNIEQQTQRVEDDTR